VPHFIINDNGKFFCYSGYSFNKVSENEKFMFLCKKLPNGGETNVLMPKETYLQMIENAKKEAIRREPSPEAAYQYEKLVLDDADKIRPNTAVNFWHNYRILCRKQASNQKEAMDVARAIIKQMPPHEQTKFKTQAALYNKKADTLSLNPLLRPFVSPQDTYSKRILSYYEENVKDLPVENRQPQSRNAVSAIHRASDAVDSFGNSVDPSLKIKIGGTVKLSLDCKTIFGENRKRLPVTEFTVLSASKDLNKIVLLDKSGNSRYTLDRERFIQKMQKLERKLELRQKKMDKFESMSY
jgi:hypothetical protein